MSSIRSIYLVYRKNNIKGNNAKGENSGAYNEMPVEKIE